MSVTRATYFLIHRETGQRYPIKGYVTIGRLTGDIVFPRDPKLSAEHCRLVSLKKGIGVKDLNSANGTYIDGVRLGGEKTYLLKAKAELLLGDQAFHLQEVSVALAVRKRRPKRRRRKTAEPTLSTFLVFLLFALGLGLIFMQWRKVETKNELSGTQHELSRIFDRYESLRDSLDHQTAPSTDIAAGIQSEVLSRLHSMAVRWAALEPRDEKQSHLLELQKRLASTLESEAQAELLYLNTGETKYQDDADQWSEKVEHAALDFKNQAELYKIDVPDVPVLIVPPLRIVEREMRKALREYRKLGQAVQNHEIPEAKIGDTLRKSLIPKLAIVRDKMGAIIPANGSEAERFHLEKDLVAALTEQVKAMALFYDTKDPNYSKSLEHWSERIEKLNAQLRQVTDPRRLPAGLPSAF